MVGYKNNLDEALEEGFSLKTGKTMAALNTAKDYAVNVGVFNKIFGQITAPVRRSRRRRTSSPRTRRARRSFWDGLRHSAKRHWKTSWTRSSTMNLWKPSASNAIDATFGERCKADAGESTE